MSDGSATLGEPVVELTAVEKVYRDFWGRAKTRALAPLTLSLERGEILALLGPNGAGKSTTIKLILGLLFPTRGRIRVLGGSARDPAQRARLGYLPEETRLHPFLTPRETLDLFGRIHGLERKERKRRIDQLVTMVGLTHNVDRPVGEFSKGMARRIGLAVALVHDPDLLILDEPTSGLDPLGTRDIKDLIQTLKARGRSVLLSSHLLDDVEDVADRIAILYGGELRQVGTTHDLLARSGRIRLELSAEGRDPLQTAQLVADALGAEEVEATVPSDRLESLFRRVVEEAEAADAQTAGARRGGGLATFLGGEEDDSLSELPAAVARIVAAGRAPVATPPDAATIPGATAGTPVEALTPAGAAALEEAAPPLAAARPPSPIVEALTAAGAAAAALPPAQASPAEPSRPAPAPAAPALAEPALAGDALSGLLTRDASPAGAKAAQPRVAGDALNAVLGRSEPAAAAPGADAPGPELGGDALSSLLGAKPAPVELARVEPARVESLRAAPKLAPAPTSENPVLKRLLGGEP